MLQIALSYAAKGWHVFPLGVKSKFPAISKDRGGKGLYDATTDPAKIKEWWTENPNFNIGIRTGEISNLLVLDVDVDKGGYDSLSKLEAECGVSFEETAYTVKTGTGGRHFYFEFPKGANITIGAGFMDGLDHRGNSGYVVAPPSLHPSGGSYETLSPSLELIGEAPVKLVSKLDKQAKKPTQIKATGDGPWIPNGKRNDHLYRRACFFRQQGQLTYEALQILNMGDCIDPVSDAELRKIYNQAMQFEDESQGAVTVTDLAFNFFEDCKANGYHLRFWNERWLRFNGMAYTEISRSEIRALLVGFLQKYPGLSKQITQGFVNDILMNLEAACRVPETVSPPEFLSNPSRPTRRIIALNNGLLDVSAMCEGEGGPQLNPHDSDFFNLAALPYDYDPKATCPKWLAFLERVQPNADARELLREWFAYNLIAETELGKFVMFVGEGANGKTVACLVLRELLGERNVSAISLEAFDTTRTFNLASLQGKLANIVEDMNELESAQEGLLKTLTTGGFITVEKKFKDAYVMKPHARLTFATNVLPRFKDRSNGLWRRMLYIPFKICVPPEEQNKHFLWPSFWRSELPGIFNWALSALPSLLQRGDFVEPDDSKVAKDEYRAETNSARSFLVSECIPGAESDELPKRTLYDRYAEYCEQEHLPTFGPQKFSQEVTRVFPAAYATKHKKNVMGLRDRVWRGVLLNEDDLVTNLKNKLVSEK